MCELFGISSAKKVKTNEYLKEFFSHSAEHPHGWGMAIFFDGIASVEKEPIQASKSIYLRERLRHSIEVRNMMAHIRLATVGSMDYENCHPFVRKDNFGRRWTLSHNGTIFNYPVLNPYFYKQEGRTDSERILYYFIDKINERQSQLKRSLTESERFKLLEELIFDMAEGNKINLLFYDGNIMYVHSNYKNSLFYKQEENTVYFSTVPLDKSDWEPLPFMRLTAWTGGKLICTGNAHNKEYKANKNDMKFLFLDSSEL